MSLHQVSADGDLVALRRLLSASGDLNLNATDEEGRSPLLVAVVSGHPAIVRELLAAGATASLPKTFDGELLPEIAGLLQEALSGRRPIPVPDGEASIDLAVTSVTSVGFSNANGPPVCRYFTSGFCRYGETCRYLHPGVATAAAIAPSSLPTYFPPTANAGFYRPGAVPRNTVECRYFKAGHCYRGSACRFLHGNQSTNDAGVALPQPSEPIAFAPGSYQNAYMARANAGYSGRPRAGRGYYGGVGGAYRGGYSGFPRGDGQYLNPQHLQHLHQQQQQQQQQQQSQQQQQQFGSAHGFTDEEVKELLAHGVQPWEDAAEAVLEALRSEL